MSKLKKICDCNNNLTLVEFSKFFVEYCDSCFWYQTVYKECTHTVKEPLLIEIEGGRTQVRMYCPICKTIDAKIMKQSGYDLSKLYKTSLASYNNYWNEINKKEQPEINQLISWIRSHKHENIKDRYTQYIQSDKWKEKRLLVIARDNNECQICGKKGEEVHHLTYIHLENEYLFELVLLCNECHNNEYHNHF